MSEDIDFILRAPIETAKPQLIRSWTEGTENILRDVECAIRQTTKAEAHWRWASEIYIPFRASPNGITPDILQAIARVARDGLQAGTVTKGTPSWPSNFPRRSREAALKIGRDINRIDTAATVTVTGDEDVVLEPEARQELRRFRVKRVPSAVEGTLRSLSDRGDWTEGRIEELFTNRMVWVRFTDAQGDQVASMYRRRVIVQGMVAYDVAGHPLSITPVESITLRPGGAALASFVGAAPELTGGLSSEDFLDRLRGNGQY